MKRDLHADLERDSPFGLLSDPVPPMVDRNLYVWPVLVRLRTREYVMMPKQDEATRILANGL